jgi:DNA (cytosine-5)-methyltransferase 1
MRKWQVKTCGVRQIDMKHLDLFSGIGGFALATEMVWDNVEHIFCDNEPFSQAILKKHWPNSLIYGDIKELTQDRIATDTRREYGSAWCSESPQQEKAKRSSATSEAERHTGIDLLTGGFPCQPFSQTGERKGTADDRHLWPEMLRVIRETKPRWVIGENVSGILTWSEGMVFDMVCSDLETQGYEVGALVIPAVSVDAPHKRDRVWFVAYSNSDEHTGRRDETREEKIVSSIHREAVRGRKLGRAGWGDWYETATALCRIYDGIPRRLDRTARLKALGNAIVPQIAAEIMKAIANIEK